MSRWTGYTLLQHITQARLRIIGDPAVRPGRGRREAQWQLRTADGRIFSPGITLRISVHQRRTDRPHYILQSDAVSDRRDRSLARLDANDDHGGWINGKIHVHEARVGDGDDAEIADYVPNPAPMVEGGPSPWYYRDLLRYFCDRYQIDQTGIQWDVERWWSQDEQ